MNYIVFLANRLNYFQKVIAEGSSGVVLSSRVPINLNAATMAITESTRERRMVKHVGAYEIVRKVLCVEDLVSYKWSSGNGLPLYLRIQFLHYNPHVVYLCLHSSTKAWYALARVTDPSDPILLSKFLADNRYRHYGKIDNAQYLRAASEIVNHRPDLVSGHAVVSAYTGWLSWASRRIARGSGVYPLVPAATGERMCPPEALPKGYEELKRALLLVYREQEQPKGRKTQRFEFREESENRPLARTQHLLGHLTDQVKFLEVRYEDSCAHLAKLAHQMGDTKLAIQQVERLTAMAQKPERKANYLLWLGSLLEDVLDFESALAVYGQALALEPKDQIASYFIYNNMGHCLNELRKYQEADWYCQIAMTVDARRHHAYTNLGVALAGQGEYLRAAHCFIQAVSLNPQSPRALRCLEDLIREHSEILGEDESLLAVVERCQCEVRRRIGGQRRGS